MRQKVKFNTPELIKLVEKNQCLWNPFLKNYRNKTVRHLAWQRISAILGYDLEFVQKQWRYLRDRYKRELNGSYPRSKDGSLKPWEFKPLMSFLDKAYGEEHIFGLTRNRNKIIEEDESKTSDGDTDIIEPITSQPVIITVPPPAPKPKPVPVVSGPRQRAIAPKITVEQPSICKPIVSTMPITVTMNSNSLIGTQTEEPSIIQKEPEIYLVTPTLFNDQERLLINNSNSTPTKRKASDADDSEYDDDMEDFKRARKEAYVEEAMLRREETERRLEWDEKEHLLRVKCLEEEHAARMQIEQARLKVEEENLKIKEQKFKVLVAKEAYFKKLLEDRSSSMDD